jgi:hypothetical protein
MKLHLHAFEIEFTIRICTKHTSFIRYQATLTLSRGSSACSLSLSFSFKRVSVTDGFWSITVGFPLERGLNMKSVQFEGSEEGRGEE